MHYSCELLGIAIADCLEGGARKLVNQDAIVRSSREEHHRGWLEGSDLPGKTAALPVQDPP